MATNSYTDLIKKRLRRFKTNQFNAVQGIQEAQTAMGLARSLVGSEAADVSAAKKAVDEARGVMDTAYGAYETEKSEYDVTVEGYNTSVETLADLKSAFETSDLGRTTSNAGSYYFKKSQEIGGGLTDVSQALTSARDQFKSSEAYTQASTAYEEIMADVNKVRRGEMSVTEATGMSFEDKFAMDFVDMIGGGDFFDVGNIKLKDGRYVKERVGKDDTKTVGFGPFTREITFWNPFYKWDEDITDQIVGGWEKFANDFYTSTLQDADKKLYEMGREIDILKSIEETSSYQNFVSGLGDVSSARSLMGVAETEMNTAFSAYETERGNWQSAQTDYQTEQTQYSEAQEAFRQSQSNFKSAVENYQLMRKRLKQTQGQMSSSSGQTSGYRSASIGQGYTRGA